MLLCRLWRRLWGPVWRQIMGETYIVERYEPPRSYRTEVDWAQVRRRG